MKRFLSLLVVIVMLSGCTADSGQMDAVLSLRKQIGNDASCSFKMSVSADYGDTVSSFELSCVSDSSQNLKVTVVEPESISGISFEIAGGTGKLVFDDQLLVLEMLADGMISPISAPWFFLKALRSGYITSCGKDSNSKVCIDDSYGQIQYTLDVWLGDNQKPSFGEIVWEGKRILSMDIYDFEIL